MIVVPPKIWKLERENKYRVPDYSDDIDEKIFDQKVNSKLLFQLNLLGEDRNRDYSILFDKKLHLEYFINDVRVGSTVDQPTKDRIMSIIKDFGIYLCK